MKTKNIFLFYKETAAILKENIELRERTKIYEHLINYLMEQNACLKLLVYLYKNNLVNDIKKFLKTNIHLPRNIDEDTLYQAIKCREYILKE